MDEMKSSKKQRHSAGKNSHHGRRPSSFWMHDPEIIFNELNLKPGDVFLDLGCGTGDYSICAAEEVGESGLVYAMDIQEELTDNLIRISKDTGLNNIRAVVGDIHAPLPFEDQTIDVCFISTVLHSVDLEDTGKILFPEINRVLKTDGRLIIIECKKEEMDFGPPLSMRISPDEIEERLSAYGFKKIDYVDLGFNYMVKFAK
jgi:SAM-dependent methyltransferase